MKKKHFLHVKFISVGKIKKKLSWLKSKISTHYYAVQCGDAGGNQGPSSCVTIPNAAYE